MRAISKYLASYKSLLYSNKLTSNSFVRANPNPNQNTMHSQVFQTIDNNLSLKFVKTRKFSREMSIALLTGISPLWHGPGGLGKTQMIEATLRSFDIPWGKLECHPDLSVSQLLGGAVARTTHYIDPETNQHYEITAESINYEKGLLSIEHFVLDEVLDAMMSVLASLKPIMTDGTWDGILSKNRMIFGATNLNPYLKLENAATDDYNTIDALLQRFLVMEQGWSSYEADDYDELNDTLNTSASSFEMIGRQTLQNEMEEVAQVNIPDACLRLLSSLASKSTTKGRFVSPRVYTWTKRLLQASAYIKGRDKVEPTDFSNLYMVGSFDTSLISDVEAEINRLKAEELLRERSSVFKNKVEKIKQIWVAKYDKVGPESIHYLAASIKKSASDLKDEIYSWSTNDRYTSYKEEYLEELDDLVELVMDTAENSQNLMEII